MRYFAKTPHCRGVDNAGGNYIAFANFCLVIGSISFNLFLFAL